MRQALLVLASSAVLFSQAPAIREFNQYRLTLRGCIRNQQQVTCEFQVQNLSDSDRVLLLDTEHLGSVALNARWQALGKTVLIDDRGNTLVASRATFANFDSDVSGQTNFTALSGTRPTMKVVFEGVGLSVQTIRRLELAIGEVRSNVFEKFPVVFEGIPIQGTAGAGGPSSADADAPSNRKVEAEDYRIRFAECSRTLGTTTVACSGGVTNLMDKDRVIYFSTERNGLHYNSLDALGITALVDEGGNTYQASSVSLAGKPGDSKSGQSWFEIGAWKREPFTLVFEKIPADANRLARLDLVAADKRANGNYNIPVRFTDISVVIRPPAAAKSPAPKMVPRPQTAKKK